MPSVNRLLPYSLPILLSLLFVGLARTHWLWLPAVLIMLAGPLTRLVGEFSPRELVAEYRFFHENPLMARFKTANGLFFLGLNGWAFFRLATTPLAGWQWAVFTYTLIILNSNFAMSLAHDLLHARSRTDRWLAEGLLLVNGFFYLEPDHLYIHHPHVGTVNDPATARLGEPIWTYLLRSMRGRMRLLLRNPHPPLHRRIATQTTLRLFACTTLLLLSGWAGGQVLAWLLCQYVFVVLIYESITYIQHYGLQRSEWNGRYEPVQLHHAWNSFYRLNTYLYFMMPVHSLHHVSRPDLSPTALAGLRMPLPFASMLLTAWQPRRWFALMNQRVIEQQTSATVPE